ncbi:hypothetical protein OG500_04350 [Kitasatospora sp. NBC_01250]|uniref:hypothetical protein n=1 Tax=unclassified Kitasatospora TaxID=2633591 RepID=UPI002E0D6B05|nr:MULTISPECIES: hypothetical protein [unclassified Kitasatospora]WSJ65360.1 hypothetical protein OG294_04195 [Kitasatospora sp. NBC_01302]
MAKIRSRSVLVVVLSAVALLLCSAFVHLIAAPPSITPAPVTLTGDTGQVLVGAVAWTENGEAMLLVRSTEDPRPSTAAVIAIADSSP